MSPSRAAPRQWAREPALPPRPADASYKNSSLLPELPAPQPRPADCCAGPEPGATQPASGGFGVPALQEVARPGVRSEAGKGSLRPGVGQGRGRGEGAPLGSEDGLHPGAAPPYPGPQCLPIQTSFSVSWAPALSSVMPGFRFLPQLQGTSPGRRGTGGPGLCPG